MNYLIGALVGVMTAAILMSGVARVSIDTERLRTLVPGSTSVAGCSEGNAGRRPKGDGWAPKVNPKTGSCTWWHPDNVTPTY